MKKKRFHPGVLVSAVLLSAVFALSAEADDGYELWLKYRKIDDLALLKEYREAIARVVVPGQSKTIRVVRDELKRGLDGLLGTNLSVRLTMTGRNSLVVATPSELSFLRTPGDLKELAPWAAKVTSSLRFDVQAAG